MSKPHLIVYTDMKSPYAYLLNDLIAEFESYLLPKIAQHTVTLEK